MPYIIAVLALAVVGVGFALSNKTDLAATPDSAVAATEETVPSLAVNSGDPTVVHLTTTNTSINNTEEEDEKDEDDEYETEDEDDETTASAITTTVNTNTVVPTPVTTPTPTPVVTPTPTPSTPVTSYTYENGTYSATQNYRTPDGSYSMNVSLTIANDAITSVDLTFSGKAARDSYSQRFLKSYETYVLGKDLENVDLSRVGGASLTTRAFNSAIDTIRSQALL